MITLLKTGTYKLIETRKHVKIFYLGTNAYAWIVARRIGEILVAVRKLHKTDCILSIGDYRLYEVEEESSLKNVQHLQLEVGNGQWQGYLLLTGLPTDEDTRVRIIPTLELIRLGSKHTTRQGQLFEK